MTTILFTSAGRRVNLLRSFQETIKEMDIEGRVLGADLRPDLSAACRVADDSFAVPAILSAEYIPTLLKICEAEKVDILIPTLDPELLPLAEAQDAFAEIGTTVLISSVETCEIFDSKRRTAMFFEENRLRTPAVVTEPRYYSGPLFAKRDRSSSAVGAGPVESPGHLRYLLESPHNYLFQPRILGEESTYDIFLTKDGTLHCAVPRTRLEIRAGEVSKAVTRLDDDIAPLLDTLCEKLLGARGPITLQVIKEAATDLIWLIEINPRFGGGYPLSYKAGANYARFILEEHLGQPLSKPDWRPGVLMLRYDNEIVVDEKLDDTL